eukprot:m.473970 g.473970  ORF g.473970 m.473970 type:complete len:80 (+) comp35329_c0_seq1:61-300(+)
MAVFRLPASRTSVLRIDSLVDVAWLCACYRLTVYMLPLAIGQRRNMLGVTSMVFTELCREIKELINSVTPTRRAEMTPP